MTGKRDKNKRKWKKNGKRVEKPKTEPKKGEKGLGDKKEKKDKK